MYNCILCHFDFPLDDTVVTASIGRCLCVRCYYKEVDPDRHMSKILRSMLQAALAAIE
jgi:hypothetical protein